MAGTQRYRGLFFPQVASGLDGGVTGVTFLFPLDFSFNFETNLTPILLHFTPLLQKE